MSTELLKNIKLLCSTTFINTRPIVDTAKLKPVVDLVNQLQPNHFVNGKFSSTTKESPLVYHSYQKTNFFTAGIFELPVDATMPLHDHPNMNVISKLLFGQVRVRAYDWEQLNTTKYPRVAKLKFDKILKAGDEALLLMPNNGNIHTFTALTHCAFFDVLAPPYSSEMPQPVGSRECTYYTVVKRIDSERIAISPYRPYNFKIETGVELLD